eukprot:4096121-Alexandrium_andersonii.AAC.1
MQDRLKHSDPELRGPRNSLEIGSWSPQCNRQSAQGPSGLQSAAIHNPPCLKRKIASGVRSLNCASRRTASKS